MLISTKKDKFITSFNERNTRWEATLNNGEVVLQDDGRPHVDEHSAWIRLKQYCDYHKLYITKMRFGFMSNMKRLPENMDGYYFAKGARGAFGMSKTIHLFFVGYIKNDELFVECWKVPEMLKETVEKRDIRKAGKCLIRKNTSHSLEHRD